MTAVCGRARMGRRSLVICRNRIVQRGASAEQQPVEQLEPRRLLAQSPFSGSPIALPGTVQAENYDWGGEGVAYHETTSANLGGSTYRGPTSVDLQTNSDAGATPLVGYIQGGEWLEYTVKVQQAGTYSLDARVASGSSGGRFHLAFDGVDKTGAITLRNTGDWRAFTTITKSGISLSAGTFVMRLSFDAAAVAGQDIGNVNWLRLNYVPTSTSLSWSNRAAAPFAREEALAATVNGKLYVFGGLFVPNYDATARVDVFDPARDTWARLKDMPIAFTHSPAVVDGQFVWFVGGYVGDHPGPGTRNVWRFDTKADTWTPGPQLPWPRGGGAAAIVGRTIYFFGGMDEGRTVDKPNQWALNLDNLAAGWQKRADMLMARNHLGVAAVNGKVYAIGGQIGDSEDSTVSNRVDVYDPAADKWAQVANLPSPRSHLLANVVVTPADKIIAMGGEQSHNSIASSVFQYDAQANQWTTLTPLPGRRRAATSGLIDGRILVTGGFDGTAQQRNTWISSIVA
jgi:N-acetylneuraminic acid mutarotase